MAKWKLHPDIEKQITAALKRSKELGPTPYLVALNYLATVDALEFRMNDGQRYIFPRERFQDLQNATRRQMSQFEILGGGHMIDWPAIDVQVDVDATLRGVFGSDKWMAELGKRGGSVTSPAKKKAARANGAKGGRPKKKVA